METPETFLNSRSGDLLGAILQAVRFQHASPGCWAALAVIARKQHCSVEDLLDEMAHGTQGFAKAVGLQAALGANDTYEHGRPNRGKNYSPLVVLGSPDDIDVATQDISSCLRHWFGGEPLGTFVRDLADVVGDMHDNVWSHGESMGVSMAFKWAKPGTDRKEHCLEFALADAGIGFLGELRRSGVAAREGISSAQEAIAWCIVKGHSSKIKDEDPWTQSLPPDVMGNPIGPSARIKSKENNHLGIGLAKLTALVRDYSGELWLSSDDCLLRIESDGTETYRQNLMKWPGVLLACRFETATLHQMATQQAAVEVDEIDRAISDLLEGREP